MLGVLGWIVFGLIVGVIAKLLMPGPDPAASLAGPSGFTVRTTPRA